MSTPEQTSAEEQRKAAAQYLPPEVAMAIRYDLADDDALLPAVVIEHGANIAHQTLQNWRCNKTATGPKPITRGRFVFYRKGDVKNWILTGKA